MAAQGDCVWLFSASKQTFGASLPPPAPLPPLTPEQVSCSCNLSPVMNINDRMQGTAWYTHLIPPLLSSSLPPRAWRTSSTATPPRVFSDIRTLRNVFLRSTLRPSFPSRPPAEQKWIAELALHNHQLLPYDEAKVLPCVPGMVDAVRSHPTITPFTTTRAVLPLINTSAAEWSLRWGSIKALRLSGPTRSFMWRLSHRRLPLLSQQWLADHYQRPTTCIMCTSGERETFSHLFSDCATASSLWSTLHPLLSLLHMNHLVDQRPARLIGDLSPFFSLSWLQTTNWSSVSASPPSTTQLLHLVRGSWTAIRAITLKAIWDARCDLLHANTPTRELARSQAHGQIQTFLRTLAYLHTPSLLRGVHRPASSLQEKNASLTWGKLAGVLLPSRHQCPPN